MENMNKKGQLTIFIIVALVIFGGIVAYFLIRGGLGDSNISTEFRPVYDYYSECIIQKTEVAINLAESQGGRIYVDSYVPGSEYAPFSSELNFLGFPVPYWFYVAGNGVVKENVPTKTDISNEIAQYIEESLIDCDFDEFYQQGYSVNIGTLEVSVKINDLNVLVNVDQDISVSREDRKSRKSSFDEEVSSKLGKFYGIAKRVYDKQKRDAFLENYTVDVLRLYAPVDGVEIQCSPKIWKTNEVFEDIKNGLEANIAAVKFKGGDYTLQNKEDKYFVVDLSSDENINLLYNPSWPTKLQVIGDGVSGALMSTEPVGNQEGLGILGFCYLPYHFVYDLSYPVMIRVYDSGEIFQFPVVVVIDKNLPRNGIYTQTPQDSGEDLCQFKTQDLEVNVYDLNLNRIDANLSYKCFDQICNLGESVNGVFAGKAPACFNGYLEAKREGFESYKKLLSTNSESRADVLLEREYEIEISLEVSGTEDAGNTAIINFIKNDKTTTAVYPDSVRVKLSEGQYEVRVYVYGNSSIVIPASSKTQCQEVPSSGIFGFFGATKEQCFNIDIPETRIEYALTGGGKSNDYLLESELQKGKAIIRVDGFAKPTSIEQMQYNFAAFDAQGVDIEFR